MKTNMVEVKKTSLAIPGMRIGVAAARTLVAGVLCLLSASVSQAQTSTSQPQSRAAPAPTLEQARLTMDKWIETQKLISKERKDWQQGKEITIGRIDLIKKEIAALEEKIALSKTGVAEADKKRNELNAENDQLKAASLQLTTAVTGMESEVRRLFKTLPEPIQTKNQPLYQRMPEDPTITKAAVAERFQNVLGILNEVNKANNEITVNYEVHTLASGKSAEVQAIYVGLGQAYYVSAGGEAGISHSTPEGWKWEPRNSIAADLMMVLD
ncbi:MAG: DUF3450 family protein, partial [Planctomycetaceae bacterium]